MIKYGKIIFLITFLALAIQSPFVFYEKPDELMFIPFVLILGGVTAYLLSKNSDEEDADFQVNIFLLAFSVRLWVGFIFYGFDFTKIIGDEDAGAYLGGWTMAQNWYKNGFDGFISDLYTVFFKKQNVGQWVIWGIPMFIAGGPSRMIVSVMNSFAGSLLVIVIYKITKKIFNSQTARVASVLVAFWASIILLSVATSKEMLVIFFEWTLLYVAIRNPKGLSVNDGFFAIPALLALYITRFYALYMCISAFAFKILISNKKNLVRNAILGVIVVGSVMVFLSASGVVDRDFDRLDRQSKNIEGWRSSVAGTTGSGVDVYSEYEGSTVAVPIAALYFFFAPFPWEIFTGSLRSSFAVLENLFIIYILIVGLPSMKIFFKDKFFEMAPIFVFCAMYAGFHIWGLANVGLAWRHKQTIMPLLFMLIAFSLTQARNRRWIPRLNYLNSERTQ